jgi:polyisoprenoid-binding protein YceI
VIGALCQHLCPRDHDVGRVRLSCKDRHARQKEKGPRMATLIQPRAEIAADAGTLWRIDPVNSTIGFSIKNLVVATIHIGATVHGRFDGFRGTIQFHDDRPHDASVEVQIDVDSIDTGITKRDAHLRSADFFDVVAYPTIAFRSTRVEPVSPLRRDRWRVVGDLTMHGVTRPVELAAELTGGGPNLWDVDVIAFAATTKINRKDFGIGRNLPLRKGEFVIGNDVKIAIDVQALKRPIGGR